MSAHLPLRRRDGSVRAWVVVDEQDLCLVGDWRWHLDSTGYAATDRHTRMHRLLLEVPSGLVVDHVNRNKLDNRRENLRIVTQRINTQNTSGSSSRVSSFRGVYLDRRDGVWYGQVKCGGRKFNAGRFPTQIEAAEAVEALRKRIFAECGRAL